MSLKVIRNERVAAPVASDQREFVALLEKQKDDEVRQFLEVYQKIVDEILVELASMEVPIFVQNWVQKLIETSIIGGKMTRGLTVGRVFRALSKDKLNEDNIFKSQILGWCVEFLQAAFLVADDVMDKSELRRGQPCRYKQAHPLGDPNKKEDTIGMIAINDAFILESLVYRLLDNHFADESSYPQIVQLFHSVTYKTELGQLLDLTSNLPNGKVDLSLFEINRYKQIAKFKTAYYSFHLPVALGLAAAGIKSKPIFQKVESILLPMGEYFQIQDDFLDCYGDPKVIGKVGRDIEENKCSWLIVKALENASPEQTKILEENYAKDDPSNVAKVKEVYEQLNLPQLYHQYEEESFSKVKTLIEESTETLAPVPTAVFYSLLATIYKRKL